MSLAALREIDHDVHHPRGITRGWIARVHAEEIAPATTDQVENKPFASRVSCPYVEHVPIFGGASRGAVLELRCPHCGVVQARAREKAGTTYRCRECKREFTREEGLAKAADAKRRR
jgi:DNA-directed RNA polymerase subunit RPC12/RpoP